MSIGNSLATYQKRRASERDCDSSGTVVIYKIGAGARSLYYLSGVCSLVKQCFGNFVLCGFLFVAMR